MHCSIPFFLSSSLALTCAHAGGIYKMWKHVGKTVCGRNGWCDTNFITVLAARKKMKKKLREKSRSEASDEWSIQNCWWLTLFSLRALHSYYFCVGKRKGKWRVRSPINIQSKEPWQLDRTEGKLWCVGGWKVSFSMNNIFFYSQTGKEKTAANYGKHSCAEAAKKNPSLFY